MYQSKECLAQDNTVKLKKDLDDYLSFNFYVVCKALKNRKVFFDKLPEVLIKRRDAKNRLQCFWVALDILKKSKSLKIRKSNKKIEYEISGLSAEGSRVFVHMRQEIIRKDKKLFLVSTYYK